MIGDCLIRQSSIFGIKKTSKARRLRQRLKRSAEQNLLKREISLATTGVRGSGPYVRPRPRNVVGKGGFLSDLWDGAKKYVPRGIGGIAGLIAGKPQEGWNAGANFSKNILGWGAYNSPWTVTKNSLISDGSTLITDGNLPVVHDMGDSGVRVKHREFIGPVYSTTGFQNTSYPLNPGMASTFAWLSQLAVSFQQYKINGALVCFKSSIPDGVSSFSSLGSLMIAAEMNSAANPALNQSQLEQMKFECSGRPSENLVAPIECSRTSGSGEDHLFVRYGSVPSNASINDYDHCYIQVATIGQPASNVLLGNLYISYDITLLNPTSIGPAALDDFAHYNTTNGSTTNPLGTSRTKIVDNFGVSIQSSGLILPIMSPGNYEICIQQYGTGMNNVTGSLATTLTNCTALNLYNGFSTLTAFGGGTSVTKIAINVTNASATATIQIGGLTYSGTIYSTDIFIYQLPPVAA